MSRVQTMEFEALDFEPPHLLKDPHLMTIMPAVWPRRVSGFRKHSEPRRFKVADGVEVLTHCHWQENKTAQPTVLVVHGLEGSSESHYVLGIAEKAFRHGMNVVRMNLRNCGGSMHLTPTLYNAGLSADVICVLRELNSDDGLKNIFLAGYSLGGNIVLKAAGELGASARGLLLGVGAVSPSIDLHQSVLAIERPANRIYEKWFLRTLKQKIREKARQHPELYDLQPLSDIDGIRLFDDIYTAPAGGYGNANNYYDKASAKHVINQIEVPALIVAAEDDPLVPIAAFDRALLPNPNLTLVTTKHGGHVGFIHRTHEKTPFDRFWAENRIVDFCLAQLGSQAGQNG